MLCEVSSWDEGVWVVAVWVGVAVSLSSEGAVMTDLNGATERGPLNAYPSNAGEFAALWNGKTERQRDEWVRFMVGEAQEAQRADREAIKFARRLETAESERDALRAQLVALCECAAWPDILADGLNPPCPIHGEVTD